MKNQISVILFFIAFSGFSQESESSSAINRGVDCLKKNDLMCAKDNLQLAYDKGAHSHPLLHNLGSIYYRVGEFDKALTLFDRAVHEYAGEAQSYNDRGQVYLIDSKYQLAMQDFNKAIQIDPSWEKPYANLGLLYKRQKNYAAAEQFLKKAIELDQNDLKAILNLSSAMVEQNKNKDAILVLDQAIKHHPKVVDLYLFRSSIQASVQDFKKACEDLQKAKDLGGEISQTDFLNICAE